MKNNRGFTLVELTIGVGLIGILGYIFMSFMQTASEETKKFQKKVGMTQDASLIERYLLTNLPSGNIRFFSFTKNSDGTQVQRVRSLYPLPGKCGDLSTASECDESVSFLFVKYAKTTTAAVSTICKYGDDYIVDLNNENFGEGTFSSGVFNVDSSNPTLFPPGPVEVGNNKLLALFSPPFANLFKVTSAMPFVINQTPNTEIFSDINFPASCKNNLQIASTTNGVNTYLVNKLYKVRLIPLQLADVSNPSLPPLSPGQDIISESDYPLRTFNVTFETFGKIKVGDKWAFSISQCDLVFPNLLCKRPIISKLANANRLRVDQKFKIGMRDSSAQVVSKEFEYEILSSNQSPTCGDISSPDCIARPLRIDSSDDIPYIVPGLNSETISNLFSAGFSMIKQEEVQSIRFRFSLDGTNKEKSFYVFLP